jgi:hypothetical protein
MKNDERRTGLKKMQQWYRHSDCKEWTPLLDEMDLCRAFT